MFCDDINDSIIKLNSRRSHLISLVSSLNKVKSEQTDLTSDFDSLIDKLQLKINKTDKQLQELCDYAVEIAMAEADVYENMYKTDENGSDIDGYMFM